MTADKAIIVSCSPKTDDEQDSSCEELNILKEKPNRKSSSRKSVPPTLFDRQANSNKDRTDVSILGQNLDHLRHLCFPPGGPEPQPHLGL